MTKTLEIRVRPVTRHVVTRFESDGLLRGASSCGPLGEFDNAAHADTVALAIQASEPHARVVTSDGVVHDGSETVYAVVGTTFDINAPVFYAYNLEDLGKVTKDFTAKFPDHGYQVYARPRSKALLSTQAVPVATPVSLLSAALHDDAGYAWSWQSNLAMLAVDAGADHRKANERAADFMSSAFGVDVRKSQEWASTFPEVETVAYPDGTTATGVTPLPTLSPAEQDLEAEIQAKGLTAPRVTPADLQANILHTEIVKHISPSGQVLRWAVLTTRNGFAVAGRPSASASSANDNAEIGERVAIDNAKQELWPLMGYALRGRLAGQ